MPHARHLEIDLDADLGDRLGRLAAATRHTASELAAEAVRGYVELNEWQMGEIRQALEEAKRGDFATDAEVASVFEKWESPWDAVSLRTASVAGAGLML